MPAFSTNSCSSDQACDQITPLPDRMIGWRALAIASTSASILLGSPSGRAFNSGRPERLQSTCSSGNLSVKDVAGEIEVNRAGLAAHRFLESDIHLLGDALEVVDAICPFGAGLHDGELVNLLENLAAVLTNRARSADCYDRAAIDQGVGDAGGEVDHSRTARRHAHAGLLRQPAVRLTHKSSRLLVAHVEWTDSFLDAGGLGQQHRPAHEKEQNVGTFVLQRFGQNL